MKNKDRLLECVIYLSILAIIISLLTIGTRLTGNVTKSGIINITILTNVKINFKISQIDFGAGNLNPGATNATIDTLGNTINGNWTPVTNGFQIENIGNVNVTINLISDKDAAQFIGGTNPSLQYNVTSLKPESCIKGDINLSQWYDVNTSPDGKTICSNLGYDPLSNLIRIDLKLVIPSDSKLGPQTNTFTAIASA